MQLGDVLLQLHRRDDALFQLRLEEATVEAFRCCFNGSRQVARATALALRDSYQRAYPHQLRLHVLSDLQWLHQQKTVDGQQILARCASRRSPELLVLDVKCIGRQGEVLRFQWIS